LDTERLLGLPRHKQLAVAGGDTDAEVIRDGRCQGGNVIGDLTLTHGRKTLVGPIDQLLHHRRRGEMAG